MYLFKTFDGKTFGTAYNEREVGCMFGFFAIVIDNDPTYKTDYVFRNDVDLNSFVWMDD